MLKDWHVEHGHFDEADHWIADYPPSFFQAPTLVAAKQYVEDKLAEGAFEAWKGGSALRLWSGTDEATCMFKDDFSADWS